MGDDEKALLKYQEAVVLYEKVLGKEHEMTSRIYRNIANKLKHFKHFDFALDYFQKALSTDLKLFGDTPYTAQTYHDMAGALWGLQDYKDALACYENALRIRIDTLGEDAPPVADTYYNMANMLAERGLLQNALICYENTIRIEEKLFSAHNMEHTLSYLKVADIYVALGEIEKGLEYYKKSLDIYLHNLGEEDINIAYIKNKIGILYGNMGQFDAALNFCCEAYNILEKYQPEMVEMLTIVEKNIEKLSANIQKA
jgi:tetratricopeptide (TPR) repeat protein